MKESNMLEISHSDVPCAMGRFYNPVRLSDIKCRGFYASLKVCGNSTCVVNTTRGVLAVTVIESKAHLISAQQFWMKQPISDSVSTTVHPSQCIERFVEAVKDNEPISNNTLQAIDELRYQSPEKGAEVMLLMNTHF